MRERGHDRRRSGTRDPLAVLGLLIALRAPLALPRMTLGRGVAIGAILSVQSYCL
jgi:hypothetical protein